MTVALVACGLGAIAVDAASKRLALDHLVEGRLYGHQAGWGLRLVRNGRGSVAALGVRRAVGLWCLVVACVVVLAHSTSATAVGLGLVLGGATGNLVDRIRRGAVVDFVSAHRWPVFNLADVSMLAGMVLVVASL